MIHYGKAPPQVCLMHYGVLGQKWGVRRFQNSDGTLTSNGKKRYAASAKEQGKSQQDINWARQVYGEESQVYQLERDRKSYDRLKKMNLKEYRDKSFGYDEDFDVVKSMYQEELDYYKAAIKDGQHYVRNSRIMEQKLSEIDVTSTRYRDVKKQVNALINEMINQSIHDSHEDDD